MSETFLVALIIAVFVGRAVKRRQDLGCPKQPEGLFLFPNPVRVLGGRRLPTNWRGENLTPRILSVATKVSDEV
jgi:hypothetical protein